MKRTIILITIVSALLMLASCNNNEPRNEADRVRLWLESTDFWVLYKQTHSQRIKHLHVEKDIYVDTINKYEHIYNSDESFYHRAPAWKFSKRKKQEGQHIDGVFESDTEKYSYDLNIDEEGNIYITVHDHMYGYQEVSNILKRTCTINGVGTDSLYVKQEDIHFERDYSPFVGDTATINIYENFFCKVDFTEYLDSMETKNNEINEKLTAVQKKMKGEWYLEKVHVVTNYENGFTNENNETHIDSMIIYSTAYPALKINSENTPSVNEHPSTFRIGTYTNGKATYDITPSSKKYKTDGNQYYTLNIGDGDVISVYFECYLPILNADGTYYLKNAGFKVFDLDDNNMIMVRNEVKKQPVKVDKYHTKSVTIYQTTYTEYWKRQQ